MKLKEVMTNNGVATFNSDPFAVCDAYEAVEACGEREAEIVDPTDEYEYEVACERLGLDLAAGHTIYRAGYGDDCLTVCFDC